MRRALMIAIVIAIALTGGTTARAEPGDHPVNGPYASAVRLGDQVQHRPPPAPPVLWTTESANARCVGMIAALEYWSPGWDVNRMAGILYRESRCDPNAANSCCTGVGQVHVIWVPKALMCGVTSRADLKDPWRNICTMAIVYRDQGMGAWSTA